MLILAVILLCVMLFALYRGAEARLTLILTGLALASLVGQPMSIVRTFLEKLTAEDYLLPIGTCMGFAFVLRHTQCDQHLVHLLLVPLRRNVTFLIPGVVFVGFLVNVPITSQSGTAVAVGAVLVPVMRAAGFSPVTAGAALALGASIGGELLNPGAPELRTISAACNTNAIRCIDYVWPLLFVHMGVTIPIFWWICLRAEKRNDTPPQTLPDDFQVNLFKAFVPLLPLVLLFLTALPERIRLIAIPAEWLVGPGAAQGQFETRLIGVAMLIGTVVAALTSPSQAGATAKVFFEGVGYALANVTSVIVAAGCFGEGIKVVGLAQPLEGAVTALPGLLMPLAALIPFGFAWISGSGIASTQALYGFFLEPAQATQADPLTVGAVTCISSAAGRTMSPVSAVVLMSASLTGAEPMAMVKRMAVALLIGLAVVALVASF
jgi:DcuC family C4-dicarboxylate transporter